MTPKTVGPKFVEPSVNFQGHTRPCQDYKTKSFSSATVAPTHPCSTLVTFLPCLFPWLIMKVSLQCSLYLLLSECKMLNKILHFNNINKEMKY
jgi:hypothetical protein